MKAPVGVVGASFALWGWSNSLLVPGLVLGGAYEALGFLPRTGAAEAQVARVMRGLQELSDGIRSAMRSPCLNRKKSPDFGR